MKKLTHEEFVNRMKEINSDIEIIGKYINMHTKIKCKCKIDGHIWEAKPNDLSNGHGCPKCGGSMKLTHEEFVNRMREINGNIEIIGEYINHKTKIKVRCKIDEFEWEVTPNGLLRGRGCPKCASKYKTTEEFKQEMKEVNDNIEILGEYKNAMTKIKCRCKKDGYEWKARYDHLLNGVSCPKCNASKGEKRIAKYLDSKNIKKRIRGG